MTRRLAEKVLCCKLESDEKSFIKFIYGGLCASSNSVVMRFRSSIECGTQT